MTIYFPNSLYPPQSRSYKIILSAQVLLSVSRYFTFSVFHHSMPWHGVSTSHNTHSLPFLHMLFFTSLGLQLLLPHLPEAYCTLDFGKSSIFPCLPFLFLHITFLSVQISINTDNSCLLHVTYSPQLGLFVNPVCFLTLKAELSNSRTNFSSGLLISQS